MFLKTPLVFPARSLGGICEPFELLASSLSPLSIKSFSSIELYRFHIFSDLWPTIFIAVALSTPARRRFVDAQWRKS